MSRSPIPEKTIKLLFAQSGNCCAFPGCDEELTYQNATVLAVICHIQGYNPGSARFNESMTDKERNNQDNLVLMCPNHHKIIDDNPDEYPKEWLWEIKKKHEAEVWQVLHGGKTESQDIVKEANKLYKYGVTFYGNSDWDGAQDAFLSVIRLKNEKFNDKNPLIASSYYYCGSVFKEKKEISNAIEAFEMALCIDLSNATKDFDFRRIYSDAKNLCSLLSETDRREEARKVFEKVLDALSNFRPQSDDCIAKLRDLCCKMYESTLCPNLLNC